MALVLNDRVKETTTTTGTGTVNLAGAEVGFETFVAGIGNTNTTYYSIVHQTADEFEVGLGTVSDSSPDTLSRTTIISSSNSDSAVNFSAGTKDVFCTLPASKAVFIDGSGDLEFNAPGDDFSFKNSSNTIAFIKTTNDDFTVQNNLNDKDFILKGYDSDGGGLMTGLTIDYSNAGKATFGGDVALADSKKLVLGAGEDLQLYHDGSNSYIVDAGTGSLFLRGTDEVKIQSAIGNNFIQSTINAGTKIYFSDAEKFETVSGGVKVTGNIENASGSMTIDVADNLSLDVDGGNIALKDAGTQWGNFANNGGDFEIDSNIQDKDIKFNGNDGGSTITALTLDMSENGNAIFNGTVNAGLKFINNAWNASAEGRNRFYFGTNSHTYLQTGDAYYFRNSSDVDIVIIDGSGNAYFDGNVTAYYSDERLKDKQGKIKNALDKVSQIETFYFKENELAKSLGHTVDKKQVGVSAQSVYEVLPEIVDLAPFDTDHETGESKSGEDYMTVDYAKLTPLLIEAIKEQQEQIETLTAKVKELEGK